MATANPKPPKRRVKELHVLVHPHFSPPGVFSKVFGKCLEECKVVEPRTRTKAAFDLWPPRKEHRNYEIARQQEALDRGYRHAIVRISKTPGAFLAILKFSHQYAPSSDSWSALQDSLIQFARNKLGKRVEVLEIEPEMTGEHLKHVFPSEQDRNLPVKVFGELKEFCVAATAKSLFEAGFTKVLTSRHRGVHR